MEAVAFSVELLTEAAEGGDHPCPEGVSRLKSMVSCGHLTGVDRSGEVEGRLLAGWFRGSK